MEGGYYKYTLRKRSVEAESIIRLRSNRFHNKEEGKTGEKEKKKEKTGEKAEQGMVVNSGRPTKRAKRAVEKGEVEKGEFVSFREFCGGGNGGFGGSSFCFGEAFRSGVRGFLERYAEGPLPWKISSPPYLQRWRLRFKLEDRSDDLDNDGGDDDDVFVTLNVVEEDVGARYAQLKREGEFDPAESDPIHCNHCRLAGWGGNPVCKRRYHFIIEAERMNRECLNCGAVLMSFARGRCKACGYDLEKGFDNDLEEECELSLEDDSHLLHGVIHANGFGHLLRVNGREGGSRFLSGCDIMSLWDRLCIILGARKISVMDVSKKYGLDYRLLHAVQKGHPWYGNWGYEFATGSYGLTYQSYKTAVEYLSQIPETQVLSDLGKHDQQLRQVVMFYYALSKKPLVTLQDLICFIMDLLHKFNDQTEASVYSTLDKVSVNLGPALSKWALKDVNDVTKDMLTVLQMADRHIKEMVDRPKWVAWQDLRGMFCSANDHELVDFVLASLEGKIVGNQIVQRRCTFSTRTVQYRLNDKDSCETEICDGSISDCSTGSMKQHVLEDLKKIYNSVLIPTGSCRHYGLGKQAGDASGKVLDCKQFVKNYEVKHHSTVTNDSMIRVLAVPMISKEANILERPPPELLLLPQTATIAHLKQEAAEAFKDVYVCFKRFRVEHIRDLEGIQDTMNLLLLLGSKSSVGVVGVSSFVEDMPIFRTERGNQSWTVDCVCGAREDDGERMIQCENCDIWQHTRCVGILDKDTEPNAFRCKKCNEVLYETIHQSNSSELGLSSSSGQCIL